MLYAYSNILSPFILCRRAILCHYFCAFMQAIVTANLHLYVSNVLIKLQLYKSSFSFIMLIKPSIEYYKCHR